MGKGKVGLYFCLIADILTKVFVPWVVLHQTYDFAQTAEFDWLVAMATETLTFHQGDEAETL